MRHALRALPLVLLSVLSLALVDCGGRSGLGGGEPDAEAGRGGETGAAGSSSGTGTAGVTGFSGTTGGGGHTGVGGYTGSAGSTATGGNTGSGATTGSGGSCGGVCAIYCPYGNVVDPSGCPTCKCNPAPVCNKDKCGPPPPAGILCPAGTVVVPPSCGAAPTGACAWSMPSCQPFCKPLACKILCANGLKKDAAGCELCECNPSPPPCTAMECSPGPKVPSQMCSDGTVAGPVCSRDAGGKCSWSVTSCPNVCPAIACFRACPNGSRPDANGCPTCDCISSAACSAHGDYKTCVSDLECTWLQPGCSTPALSTPGCYAQTDVDCGSDAECSGARQCLKRSVNPCYAPGAAGTCDACGVTRTVCL